MWNNFSLLMLLPFFSPKDFRVFLSPPTAPKKTKKKQQHQITKSSCLSRHISIDQINHRKCHKYESYFMNISESLCF